MILYSAIAFLTTLIVTANYVFGSKLPNKRATPQYFWESKLIAELFSNRGYNKAASPYSRRDQAVDISLELVVLKIDEILEKEQEIILSGFLKSNWTDSRLQWAPAEFGGLQWIVCSSTLLWLPDVGLVNSPDVYHLTRDTRFPVTISSQGEILFVPAGTIRTRCELTLEDYPWDNQLCKLRFESWMYPARILRIVGKSIHIDHSHFIPNPHWLIANTTTVNTIVHYDQKDFSRCDFQLYVQRKALDQVAYTIFPCLALSLLQVLSHILPFYESERVKFATTALMSFAIFHLSIVEQMPKTSDELPTIAIYIDALMSLIAISLIECFLCLQWIARVSCTVPSPFWWWLVVENLGKLTVLGNGGNYWRRKYLSVYEQCLLKNELEQYHQIRNAKSYSKVSNSDVFSEIKPPRFHSFDYKDFATFSKSVSNVDLLFIHKILELEMQRDSRHGRSSKRHATKERFAKSTSSRPWPRWTEMKIDENGPWELQRPNERQFCEVPMTDLNAAAGFSSSKMKAENSVDRLLDFTPKSRLIVKDLKKKRPSKNVHLYRPGTLLSSSSSSSGISSSIGDKNYSERQMVVISRLVEFLEHTNARNWHSSLKHDCLGVWKTFITIIDQCVTFVLLAISFALPFSIIVHGHYSREVYSDVDPGDSIEDGNDGIRTSANVS